MELARVTSEALTAAQHTALMRTRKRPLTDPPIQRRKADNPWVATTDETIFGYHIEKGAA